VGSRGIPASYGGFETFAEEIAVHLVRNHGFEVTVVCDQEQAALNNGLTEYKGVKIRYSSFAKGKNAIRFYHDSIASVVDDHDIVYSCGPAGGLFGWLVHRHGKIMMTNPDGLNSQRSKWSYPVKVGFRLFERAASFFSDRVICDSEAIERYVRERYACRHTDVAEYGAYVNPYVPPVESEKETFADKVLSEFGLVSGQYHLVVSRLEPENNVKPVIQGYQAAKRQLPLVIVGNLKSSGYVEQLKQIAGEQVRFVGGIYDKDKLAVVRAYAASYFHGHSVGGTNPSLLEAMGSRNLCICHDNQFNREVVGENGLFFADAGQVDEHLLNIESDTARFESMRDGALIRVRDYYNWDNMAEKYHRIFTQAFASSVR
jgi:glycosyltransferase involved in cell wall biosynthesis